MTFVGSLASRYSQRWNGEHCCAKVRTTCLKHATTCTEYVTIRQEKIPALVEQIRSRQEKHTAVPWDDEEWHYTCPDTVCSRTVRKERGALYILALDAINFCFWPCNFEYDDLAKAMTHAAEADHAQQHPDVLCDEYLFSPHNLQTMTVSRMEDIFVQYSKSLSIEDDKDDVVAMKIPPNLAVRVKLWNEIGTVLLTKFNGSVLHLIDVAQGSAPKLVDIVVSSFAGFRDYTTVGDAEHTNTEQPSPSLYFLKRAQIFVGDINASLQLQLTDMDVLTTFADYRVPQLLRHYGILVYSFDLSQQVDGKSTLPPAAEHAIRATTVAAVEYVVTELNAASNTKWNAVQTDWYLWQVGEKLNHAGQLAPHHRVVTTFY